MNKKTLDLGKSCVKRLGVSIKSFCLIGVYTVLSIGSLNAQQLSLDEEYRDTEFGELLYNEASIATRLELLRLLSKDTPSVMVFMHGISMGLGIDDMLEAAVQYQPDKARDFAESAISLLPLLSETQDYTYSEYELEDLERKTDSEPYSVKEVMTRFFENRELLGPHPDWFDGQYHFDASVVELKELVIGATDTRWYFDRDGEETDSSVRPVFVSFYEASQSILIDDAERLAQASIDSTLPVVFVFNRERERSIDKIVELLNYPRTIKGVQQAYSEYSLMVTPVPEWQSGEYHIQAEIDEIGELFDLPEEDDFEPEHWQRLLEQAQEYQINQPSFLMVVMTGDDGDVAIGSILGAQYAAYEDPREEEAFPFVRSDDRDNDSRNGDGFTMRALMSKGLIINRPDLIAAIKSIGAMETVPIAFHYIDNARTKPYKLGPRALRLTVTGIRPPGLQGGGGGFGPPALPSIEPPVLPGIEPEPPVLPDDDVVDPPDLPGGGGFDPPPDCASPPCAQ